MGQMAVKLNEGHATDYLNITRLQSHILAFVQNLVMNDVKPSKSELRGSDPFSRGPSRVRKAPIAERHVNVPA